MEAIVADINRTLKGWFGYFKHVHPSELSEFDQWLRMRLRSILRKRRGGRGRGRGRDHHRWPNRYFTGLGLFCLLDAKVSETTSLRQGANHRLESRVREICTQGSEGGSSANQCTVPTSIRVWGMGETLAIICHGHRSARFLSAFHPTG